MAIWRSTIMPQNAHCGQSSWEERIIYFTDRMPEANAPQRSTASSDLQNSTASTLKRTCARCSRASPIIPSTASKNCCHGTSQRSSPENQAELHSQLHPSRRPAIDAYLSGAVMVLYA